MFSEIAEKYPKTWGKYWEPFAQQGWISVPFQSHFGNLVLEFFPKHWIEIERIVDEHGSINYFVLEININNDVFHTPEEAIEKAFEILEERCSVK